MDINFLSLSTSPSDHECQDGDFAAALNVINEDGAMHAIQQPQSTGVVFNLGSSELTLSAKYYIHTIDNDDPSEAEVKHYIAKTSDSVLWYNEDSTASNKWETIVSDFVVNSVQFIGRIICLIGNTETRWAFWRGTTEGYKVFTYDDFNYNIDIYDEPADASGSQQSATEYEASLGADFSGYFNLSAKSGDEGTYIISTTKEGTAALVDRIIAQVNKVVADDEELQCNISFGIAALRLYDGSHIMLSDIFVIGGAQNFKGVTMDFTGGSSCTATAKASLYLHKDQIRVTMSKLSDLSSIVEGVDFYLTAPSFFRKYDKSYSMYTEGATNNIYPWKDGGEKNISFDLLDDTEYTTEIDSMSFYHSLFISRNDIINGEKKYLKTISETNKSITLADFYRAKYGAQVAHLYNSRLDIGDYTSVLDNDAKIKISYHFCAYPPTTDPTYSGDKYVLWNDHRLDVIEDGDIYACDSALGYARIHWSNSYGESRTTYMKLNTCYPLPPMLMIPMKDIDSIDIYFYISSQKIYKYAENIPFHTADLGSWSYFLFHYIIARSTFYNNYGPAFIQNNAYKDGLLFLNTDTNGTKWNECATEYTSGTHTITNRYRNSILVSDSDNPIVFRAANTVTVGNGHVLALAAASQPVSLGQAGQTPLYAFTSEGIYPLYVDESNGAFKATQPGARDIPANDEDGNYNLDSICPLDNAVCFASNQGIMILAGNDTQCISDNLRLPAADRTLPYLGNVMQFYDSSYTSNDLKDYSAGDFQKFLQTCRTVYDYTNQRILFIQSSDDDNPMNNHLVFSLRSKAWSMLTGKFYDTINSYPEAKVLVKIGSTDEEDSTVSLSLCNVHRPTPLAVPYYLITRPLKLGAPDIFKRLQVAIVRGDFRSGEVGQALYGSNDLKNWFFVTSSNDQYLRRHAGTPYKYYRFALVGTLQPGSSLQGISLEATASITNKLR